MVPSFLQTFWSKNKKVGCHLDSRFGILKVTNKQIGKEALVIRLVMRIINPGSQDRLGMEQGPRYRQNSEIFTEID